MSNSFTLDDVLHALRLAGIHSASCSRGKRDYRQQYTGAWLPPEQYTCDCWVDNPHLIAVDSDAGGGPDS